MPPFDDLPGTLHAAAVLFLPGATGGLILAMASAPDRDRVARASVVSFLLLVCFFLLGIYFTTIGWPMVQLAVTLACVWATIFMSSDRVQRIFCSSLLFAGLGLLVWYAILAQGRYVGSADWVGGQQDTYDTNLKALKKTILQVGAADRQTYREGWLDETDLAPVYDQTLRDVGTIVVERGSRVWHSWLTWLYARVPLRRGIYFPGGTVEEGVPLMEYRDRP